MGKVSRLFANTEATEYPIENVVRMNRSADLAEGVEGSSQFDGEQLVAEELLGGILRHREAVDTAIKRVPRAGGGRGQPLAPMRRLEREAVDDLRCEGSDAFTRER